MSDMTANLMFQEAIMNLSNGYVDPVDKEILSYAPLPDSLTEPFVTQTVDALQTMNLTNNALHTWVGESKKASYFTPHFATLSRMIMNGVSTMARGLVTLHMRGEDLEQAPLSIQDLISISSYQFKKSYLGVLQTVRSHPEISERLLSNQLRWTNTLMKLFKTKEKLEKPFSAVRIQDSEVNSVQQASVSGKFSDAGEQNVKALSADYYPDDTRSISGFSDDGLKELPALSAPGAYGAVQAFSSFANKKSESRNKGSACRNQYSATGIQGGFGTTGVLSGKTVPDEIGNPNSGALDQDGSVTADTLSEESLPEEIKDRIPEEKIQRQTDPKVTDDKKEETLSDFADDDRMDHEDSVMSSEDEEKQEKNDSHVNSGDGEQQVRGESDTNSADVSSSDVEKGIKPADHGNIPDLSDMGDGFPFLLESEHPPEYFEILYRASCRSTRGEGTLEFTMEEIHQLIDDPEFLFYEPKMAAEFRKILEPGSG